MEKSSQKIQSKLTFRAKFLNVAAHEKVKTAILRQITVYNSTCNTENEKKTYSIINISNNYARNCYAFMFKSEEVNLFKSFAFVFSNNTLRTPSGKKVF